MTNSLTSIRALFGKILGESGRSPAAVPRSGADAGQGPGMPLPRTEDHFKSAFVHSAIGMALVSLDGRWLQVNRSLSAMLGYSVDELLQTTFQALTHPDDLPADLEYVRRLSAGEIESYSMEKRYFHKDGRTICALLSVSLVRDEENKPLYFISQIQDVTARKRYEEEIRYLATHDSLTGLTSAALLDDRLTQAMARTGRSGNKLMAVLFLDLDRFKVVNDSLGHAFGDRLLKAVAERLQGCMRSSDTIARRGGDEFVLLVEDLAAPEDVLFAVHKIQQSLAKPVPIDAEEVVVTATIGAALYPPDGDTAERLLTNAEAAMYRAKLEGGGGFNFYTAELGHRTLERFGLESALRQAADRGEFELYYQPQVRLADQSIAGFEALIRWHRPGHGLVLPARFIALAEETGLIVPIGEWVLRTAAEQLRRWRTTGSPRLRMAVNVSARQFWQGSLVKLARDMAEQGLFEPGDLEIELTEGVVMKDAAQTIRLLTLLKELGLVVTIDDFGTGYSSLAYLQRLPVQRLKIDRSFTDELGVSAGANELVRQIIDLGHAMHLAVVAEGIEVAEQFELLRGWGCDEGQGHFFARAMTAAACTDLLASGLAFRSANADQASPQTLRKAKPK